MVSTTRHRLVAALVASWAAFAAAAWLGAQTAAPRRIVSTSPSITETLFALGLGDRVVGVSTYCRFPAEVSKLPKVGTFLKPDSERIAALGPDLVFVHEVSDGLDRRLTSLAIPFVVVDRGAMSTVFSSIRQIGAAAGVAARADALTADLRARLQRVGATNAAGVRPRVLFIIGRRPGMLADLIGVGPNTYLNELIAIAGGVNVLDLAGQPQYPNISMEAVLRFDPDVIIDTVDMGDTDTERRQRQPINERLWAAYGMLSAVKNRRVHAATTDALVVPGPRIVEAAEWIAAEIRRVTPR